MESQGLDDALSTSARITNRNALFKAAYATLLTSDSFTPGLKVLLYSLSLLKPSYPILLLHTPNIPSYVLKELTKDVDKMGDGLRLICRCVQPIPQPNVTSRPTNHPADHMLKLEPSSFFPLETSKDVGTAPKVTDCPIDTLHQRIHYRDSASVETTAPNVAAIEKKVVELNARNATEALSKLKWKAIPLSEGTSFKMSLEPRKSSSVAAPSWESACFTKLRVWEQTDYNVIVYIDADCIVLNPIEELFQTEHLPAFAPDIFPPDRFNCGVMVLAPDAVVFKDMLHKLEIYPSYDGADTGFLNAYFPDWYKWPSEHRLAFRYNALRTMYWFTHKKRPGYWESVQPIKILHYCSSPKPWENGDPRGDLELKWWMYFLAYNSGEKVEFF